METWVAFVTELSFPIAITFYLLHRIEGKLDVLNESIRMLPDKMKRANAALSFGRVLF